MKAIFVPVYSNINGIYNLYNCIDYEIDLLHILSKPDLNLKENKFIKNVKVEKYTEKFKSLAQIWNYFIESYDIDDYVIMNDDITFDAGYIEYIFNFIKTHPNTYRLQSGMPHVVFSTSRYVYQTIGPYDENYVGAYYEDTDYRYRCLLNKIDMPEFLPNMFNFKHEKNGTLKTCTEHQKNYIKNCMDKNRKYFYKKWNGFCTYTATYQTPFNL